MKALSRRLWLLQAGWDYRLMQGAGFSWALKPALGAERAKRHLEYFNTHPYAAPAIAGMVCKLEEEVVAAPEAERAALIERLHGLKRACASAFAALGDALFWGALRPGCAALALVAEQLTEAVAGAAALGPIEALGIALLYLAAFNRIALATRRKGLALGLESGAALVAKVQEMRVQDEIRQLRGLGMGLAAAGVALMAWNSGPGQRLAALAATAAFWAALRWLPRASTTRLYAASALAALAGAWAGWL